MPERPVRSSKIPQVSRRVATEAPGAEQAIAAFDSPAWSLPGTIALVTAASAALWLTIVELSRWLASWMDASPTF
jgi:hypothetical protein